MSLRKGIGFCQQSESPYIRAFFLLIDSFENLFENLYKKTKKHYVSFFTNAMELIKNI
jgi:hypothetical protein